jgi:hypothetical protein
MLRKLAPAGAAAILVFGSQNAAAAPADELRQLLEQGRAAQAYLLGKQHPNELGKPEFDFYFGIAATDSGHAGEGVLALERYVIQFPDNLQARLELGRAYFVLGELLRAREEFEAVQRLKPPSGVQANIDRFLDAITAQETRYKTSATGYVEFGGGYDSNVNSGVSEPTVNLPGGSTTVIPAGVKQDAWFLLLGAGANFSLPAAAGVSIIGGFSADGKLNAGQEAKQFDQHNISFYGGTAIIRDRDLYRLTASFSQTLVDYKRFRNVTGIGGEWHRQVDELNTGSVALQFAKLEYPKEPFRDADFLGIGGGWRHSVVNPVRPVLQLQVMGGRERNDAGRDDLSRDLLSMRGTVSVTPAALWSLSSSLSYIRSEYQETDVTLGDRRRDNYFAFEAGAAYRVVKPVTLRLEYLYAHNASNLDLFEYRRHVVTLKARYEF